MNIHLRNFSYLICFDFLPLSSEKQELLHREIEKKLK